MHLSHCTEQQSRSRRTCLSHTPITTHRIAGQINLKLLESCMYHTPHDSRIDQHGPVEVMHLSNDIGQQARSTWICWSHVPSTMHRIVGQINMNLLESCILHIAQNSKLEQLRLVGGIPLLYHIGQQNRSTWIAWSHAPVTQHRLVGQSSKHCCVTRTR